MLYWIYKLALVQPLRHPCGMPPLLVGEALAIHEKQNLFAKGSPTRKDSLRPEGDVAQATEGGQLSAKQTERFI